LLELANLIGLEPGILTLPSVKRLLGNPDLPDQIRHRQPKICLLQYRYNLFNRKPLLLQNEPPSGNPSKTNSKPGPLSPCHLSWLYGLVAFAIIGEEPIEWTQHYEENNGSAPSAEQTKNWYEQKPESILLRAKGDAEGTLATHSAMTVDQALEDKREELLVSTVIAEIRTVRRFWPQFGVSMLGGLSSALVFAALLIVMAWISMADVSPLEPDRKI